MSGGCPGQDGRSLQVSLYTCTNCGAEVEIFSDETRARCHACKQWVCTDEVPTCVEWCAKARECVGEERWARSARGMAEAAAAAAAGAAGTDVADV
jgi:DNA-directed RNA polymerase subunit RPC12/RpoP